MRNEWYPELVCLGVAVHVLCRPEPLLSVTSDHKILELRALARRLSDTLNEQSGRAWTSAAAASPWVRDHLRVISRLDVESAAQVVGRHAAGGDVLHSFIGAEHLADEVFTSLQAPRMLAVLCSVDGRQARAIWKGGDGRIVVYDAADGGSEHVLRDRWDGALTDWVERGVGTVTIVSNRHTDEHLVGL